MKANRKPRAYKIADEDYLPALNKEANVPLATNIESWVKWYGEGYEIGIIKKSKQNHENARRNIGTRRG